MNMKFLLIFSFCMVSGFSYDKDDIIRDYADAKFKKICLESAYFYKNGGKDENLLSIIGDSCVKSDFINPLGYIVKNLISTPKFRQNASYFGTILLQKKLIYQFVNDNLDLSNLRLPKTDHILSIVFENLATNNYKKLSDKIKIILSEHSYVLLYTEMKSENSWVVLEEYENDKLKTRHWYI